MQRAFFLLCAPLFFGSLSQAQSYLVTPFFDLTGDPALRWMGESASSFLTDALARENLLVVNRTDREEVYRRLALRRDAPLTSASILKAAMAADASFAITGRIEKADGGIRLLATLFDVKALASGPEFASTGTAAQFPALITHLAWQALQFTAPARAPSKEEYLQRYPPIAIEALEQHALSLTAANDDQRLLHLTRALKATPGFAAATLDLGRLYARRKQWQEAALWFSRVDPRAPGSREALFWLGIARYQLGDFEGSAQAFASVAQSVPLSEVWNNLGVAETRRGPARFGPAEEAFAKAVEGDAAEPTYRFNWGLLLLRAGRRDEAASRFREAVERDPADAAATELLGRSIAPQPAGELRHAERLKWNYEETAWLQLKALLGGRAN